MKLFVGHMNSFRIIEVTFLQSTQLLGYYWHASNLTLIKLLINRWIDQTNKRFTYTHLSTFHPVKATNDFTKRENDRVVLWYCRVNKTAQR